MYKFRVLVVKPNKAPYMREITNTPDIHRRTVGGILECSECLRNVLMVWNPDAWIHGQPNFSTNGIDFFNGMKTTIYGTAFFCHSTPDGDFGSLDKRTAERVKRFIKEGRDGI